MLNVPMSSAPSPTPAPNLGPSNTENAMGRVNSFQSGMQDHLPNALQPPKVTTADITASIK